MNKGRQGRGEKWRPPPIAPLAGSLPHPPPYFATLHQNLFIHLLLTWSLCFFLLFFCFSFNDLKYSSCQLEKNCLISMKFSAQTSSPSTCNLVMALNWMVHGKIVWFSLINRHYFVLNGAPISTFFFLVFFSFSSFFSLFFSFSFCFLFFFFLFFFFFPLIYPFLYSQGPPILYGGVPPSPRPWRKVTGSIFLFSCGHATLYKALSVRRSVGPLVRWSRSSWHSRVENAKNAYL